VPTSHDVHRELIRELYVAFTPISMPLDVGAVDAKESVHAAHKSKREYPGVECWRHVDCRLWTSSLVC
jgi:hypothetical protein